MLFCIRTSVKPSILSRPNMSPSPRLYKSHSLLRRVACQTPLQRKLRTPRVQQVHAPHMLPSSTPTPTGPPMQHPSQATVNLNGSMLRTEPKSFTSTLMTLRRRASVKNSQVEQQRLLTLPACLRTRTPMTTAVLTQISESTSPRRLYLPGLITRDTHIGPSFQHHHLRMKVAFSQS